jgi:hypothetical protein
MLVLTGINRIYHPFQAMPLTCCFSNYIQRTSAALRLTAVTRPNASRPESVTHPNDSAPQPTTMRPRPPSNPRPPLRLRSTPPPPLDPAAPARPRRPRSTPPPPLDPAAPARPRRPVRPQRTRPPGRLRPRPTAAASPSNPPGAVEPRPPVTYASDRLYWCRWRSRQVSFRVDGVADRYQWGWLSFLGFTSCGRRGVGV